MNEWWRYENLESGEPYEWASASRGDSKWDNLDFHLDLGAGKLPKARLGIDRYPADGVGLVMDLNTLVVSPDYNSARKLAELYKGKTALRLGGVLPFPDDSIESIVSHHAMEHIGDGFIRLMDECYRVLKPGGVLRIIVPLFPSRTAVEDADHRRYFMTDTFDAFCGSQAGDCWLSSFSVPYTKCRFEMVDKDYTQRLEDPAGWWGPDDAREIRVALRKHEEVVASDVGPVQETGEVVVLHHNEGDTETEAARELVGAAST